MCSVVGAQILESDMLVVGTLIPHSSCVLLYGGSFTSGHFHFHPSFSSPHVKKIDIPFVRKSKLVVLALFVSSLLFTGIYLCGEKRRSQLFFVMAGSVFVGSTTNCFLLRGSKFSSGMLKSACFFVMESPPPV